MKELISIIKKFESYDRVYYDGKLTIALIVLLSFLSIGCFILAFVVFK